VQTLLDHTTAQIGINEPHLSLPNGSTKLFFGYPFAVCEAAEWLSFENAHSPLLA